MTVTRWQIEPFAQLAGETVQVVFQGVDEEGETCSGLFILSPQQALNLAGTLRMACQSRREGIDQHEVVDPAAAAHNRRRERAIQAAQDAYHAHGAKVGWGIEFSIDDQSKWLLTDTGVEEVDAFPGLEPAASINFVAAGTEVQIWKPAEL